MALYRPMPDRRKPIRRVTHDLLDTTDFFFSFEFGLPKIVSGPFSGGPQE